jgi:hypothetical protein
MRYLAPLVVIVGIAAYLSLYFSGCEQPVCRVIGVYKYRVNTLPEYVDYVAGSDLFRIHGATSLAFSCEALRDQLTETLHETMVAEAPLGNSKKLRDEVVRLGLLGARREGKILHMMNNVTVGGLDAWAQQLRSMLENEPKDVREQWLPVVMKRLFQLIVLHSGDKQVQIDLPGKYKCP